MSRISEAGPLKVDYIFPNGDRYEGECESDAGVVKRNGHGKQTFTNGIVYTGGWLNDKMNSEGTLKHPSGAVYEGQFKDNMYHGAGTYTFPDGSTYTGQLCKNKLVGKGTITSKKGLVWTGEFHGTVAPGLQLQYNVKKET